MLPTPKKVKLAVGKGEGNSELTAFDRALLDAGIGNLNLIKVSSILPPNCEWEEDFEVPAGSLTPTAYGAATSDKPGELIAAAIGIGFSSDDYGVIMEFHGHCSESQAAAAVEAMVREAFEVRGKELKKLMSRAVAHEVESIGSVVAAAVLWY